MIAHHYDYNAILVAPFKLRKDSYQLLAYNETTTCLKQLNNLVDLQNLDNEASAEYRSTMWDIWKVDYQLFPPNLHFHNVAKRAICMFKAHLL